MFYLKKSLMILAILVLCATVLAPNISHAWEKVIEFEVFGETIEVTLSCFATFCFPISGPSGVINEDGCLEISLCGGIFYCSATICPDDDDDDDDDDSSGNNDDSSGNN